MSDTKILCPAYFQIARYDGLSWYFKNSKKFFNPLRILIPKSVDLTVDTKLVAFDTSFAKLTMEFRLINGGKIGYYLADLKNSNYYYCGLDWQDIKTTLRSLGIGVQEPRRCGDG